MLFGIQFTPMVESKENCLPVLLTQSKRNHKGKSFVLHCW